MRKPGDVGIVLAAKVLPVALLFVSVAAVVRVVQESGQLPMSRLIASLLGPFATGAVLLGMCCVAMVWFVRGDIAFPFRKILALALVGLPTALLFGVLQPAHMRLSWGGIAGANLGSVVGILPDTLAAGLSVLLLVGCAWLAWRLAFGRDNEVTSAQLAFAGMGSASGFGASPMTLVTEPMRATALADEEDTAVGVVEPRQQQSTLFDTLGDTESMLRAAEEAANTPLTVATIESNDTVVPPWLAASAEAETTQPFDVGIDTAEDVATAAPLTVASDVPVAVQAASIVVPTDEEISDDLNDITDLMPLEGEDAETVQEDLIPVLDGDAGVQTALVEELEDDDLLAEDSAGDFTIDDDIDAEIEPLHAEVSPVVHAAQDDEFSLAAAEAQPTPVACAAATQPVVAAASSSNAVSMTAAPLAQQDNALLVHPALLALSASFAAPAPAGETPALHDPETPAVAELALQQDDAIDVIWAEDDEVPVAAMAVSEPASSVAMEAIPAQDSEAEFEDLPIRPMLVGQPALSEAELDCEVAAAFNAADDAAFNDEASFLEPTDLGTDSVLEEQELSDALVATAHDEAPLFTAAASIAETTQLFTPAEEAPQLTFHLEPREEVEKTASRPQFTLLRGGPETEAAPVQLPAHLDPAALAAAPAEVASEPAAKPKGSRKSRKGSAWASWEEGTGGRRSRNEPRADDAQAFLFAESQETEPELLARAAQIVVAEQRCSELMLQRKLDLSWSAASRIIDHLQRDGVIGAPDASGRREVLRRAERSADPDIGF